MSYNDRLLVAFIVFFMYYHFKLDVSISERLSF